MTYLEYYEQVYKEYKEASAMFLQLDNELFKTNGFGNFMDLPNYSKAYKRWQTATNNYRGFLLLIKGKDVEPDDQISLI